MAMPPQLKTIAILALDDAIIRLTQAKTSLTEAHSFLIFFLLSFIPYDTSAGAEIPPRHCGLGIVSPQCLGGISAAAEVP